jgi:hypothetical protein
MAGKKLKRKDCAEKEEIGDFSSIGLCEMEMMMKEGEYCLNTVNLLLDRNILSVLL